MANLAKSTQVRQVCAGAASGMQVPIKASNKIYMGAMVCALTASGLAVPAGTASTGGVLGVAQAEASTPTNDGDYSINLLCGVFAVAPDATNPPTQANVGGVVYAKDDNHVSNLSSDGPIAGTLVGFEATTGWPLVYIGPTKFGIPTAVTGALSTVTDAAAKAVLTSIIAALKSHGLVLDSTT